MQRFALFFIGCFALVSLHAQPAIAGLQFFSAYDEYDVQLHLFESGQCKLTLEQLYKKAKDLNEVWKNDLRLISAANKDTNYFESEKYQQDIRPYDDFAENKKRMHFSASFIEWEFAEPSDEYYKALAAKKGRSVDVAFFKAMTFGQRTYQKSVTDYSYCTEYGKGHIIKSFGEWSQYMKRYPNSYRDIADEQLKKATDELMSGSCVCGTKGTWRSELTSFTVMYPKSKLTLIVKHRLKSPIYAAPTGEQYPMRFNCSPG